MLFAGAVQAVFHLILQAGPPPLSPEDLQALYIPLAVLLAARLVVGPIIYLDARRRSLRDSWWGSLALVSPLVGGILYLVLRQPRDRPGPSSWNPWVVCPQCGAPRGWSPDPCPRCGSALPAQQAAPRPGYPLPPPGYGPPAPGYGPPAPGYGPPRPGYAPVSPETPEAKRKKLKDVTGPQVLGALFFAVLLTNVVATLALLPMVFSGTSTDDLLALQQSPVFILLALVLQDSLLLFVALDQSLLQGRMTRRSLGLGWSKSGHRLRWHLAIGVGAGVLTFTFSAFLLDLMVRTLAGLGIVDPTENLTYQPTVLTIDDYLLYLPSFVVIAPVVEEFFFRGYALGGFAQRGHVNQGVIFTSLLFAAIHLNPFTFPALAAAGLVLAAVYLRTGSLVAPIVGHATNNFIAVTLALYGF